MDEAADIVLGALSTPLQFDSGVAGRRHAAAGGAVRDAVERAVAEARQWALAARETARALREGAGRYEAEDLAAAAVLR